MAPRTSDSRASGVSDLTGQIWRRIRGRQTDRGAVGLVDQVVSGFYRLAREFGDLDFAGPGGILELRPRLPSVTSVRFEIPKTESLRLSTVLIDAEGVSDLRHETTVTASNLRDESGDDIRQRLFDPQDTAVVVETRKQYRPWLEVTFDRPVDITRIRVRNVEDAIAVRMRGMQVLVHGTEHGWATVYDQWRRERALVHAVERQQSRWVRSARRSAPIGGGAPAAGTYAVIGDLAKILTEVHLRDYATVQQDLDRVDLGEDAKVRFKTLVNSQIAEREREWNIHGIKRTFRFWSEQEKRDYIGFAVDVVNRLRELTDNVCFGFGSVLAAVRDQDLIPHDNDADLIIGFEPSQAATRKDAMALVAQCLEVAGYPVGPSWSAHTEVRRPVGGQKLDVFVGIFEDDTITWDQKNRGPYPRDIVFPPQDEEFFGYTYPVPCELVPYLEQSYGPGWKTPDPHAKYPKNKHLQNTSA